MAHAVWLRGEKFVEAHQIQRACTSIRERLAEASCGPVLQGRRCGPRGRENARDSGSKHAVRAY